MSSTGRRVAAALLALTATGLVASGCGDFDAPLSATDGVESIRLFRDNRAILGPIHVEKAIKANGGRTPSLNRYSIVIPANAPKQDTQISISEAKPVYVLGDFGPEGTGFPRPIEFSMSHESLDLGGVLEDRLTMYWINPETRTWFELQARVDGKAQNARLEVGHYSRYALSDHWSQQRLTVYTALRRDRR